MSVVRILRIIGCIVFAGIGIILLLGPLSAIPKLSQLPAYQLGGLTGSLLMALLAFALAWQCGKRRS
jgi:energy-converting hydrogenase Eha subunit C